MADLVLVFKRQLFASELTGLGFHLFHQKKKALKNKNSSGRFLKYSCC
jgi:hypothetical protein